MRWLVFEHMLQYLSFELALKEAESMKSFGDHKGTDTIGKIEKRRGMRNKPSPVK